MSWEPYLSYLGMVMAKTRSIGRDPSQSAFVCCHGFAKWLLSKHRRSKDSDALALVHLNHHDRVFSFAEIFPNVFLGVLGQRVGFASRSRVSEIRQLTVTNAGKEFDKNWLNANPLVLALGVVGWCVPSSIGVPAFDGNSLTGLFLSSIGEELSHWPTGPSIDSSFW